MLDFTSGGSKRINSPKTMEMESSHFQNPTWDFRTNQTKKLISPPRSYQTKKLISPPPLLRLHNNGFVHDLVKFASQSHL